MSFHDSHTSHARRNDFHGAPRGTKRCHTNFSHDTFLVGLLHRFTGAELQRPHIRGGVFIWRKCSVRFKMVRLVVGTATFRLLAGLREAWF